VQFLQKGPGTDSHILHGEGHGKKGLAPIRGSMIARLHRLRLTWFVSGALLPSCAVITQEARQATTVDPLIEDRLMEDLSRLLFLTTVELATK